MAVLDRLENRLTPEEEASIVSTTRELLGDTADAVRRAEAAADVPPAESPAPARVTPLRVLGFPVGNSADELALEILAKAVDDLPVTIEITPRLLSSELAAWTSSHGITVVCVADLPPHVPSRARYLVKKLRAFSPDIRITVGRWATSEMADESNELLTAAGANHVASTIEQSRAYLRELATPAAGA